MLKRFQRTLSIGLGGLLALGIGVASASDVTAKRVPNVLHEMVPHVVLPETIQYNKMAKSLPGVRYAGASPYVGTYVAYPSYQVPYAATFKPVGQSVYPVSPKLLPAPLPKEEPEIDPAVEIAEEELTWLEFEGREVTLNNRIAEPIQLAAGGETVIPILPTPNSAVVQTGIFCQQPAKPPSAWAFSSPLFKVASVPAGWGGQQVGSINHHSPRGSGQQVGFHPASVDPATGAVMPQGAPYSTFQMGQGIGGHGMVQNAGTQVHVLPNGMLLLTMPPDHRNCGLIRCRAGHSPRTMLLPPAGHGLPLPPQAVMPPMPAMQNAMMSGGFGMPTMPVSQGWTQPLPQQPQMQSIPITAMTPMGPAVVGYQQIPMMNLPMMNPMAHSMAMNPMTSPMINPMAAMNPQLPHPHQMQMAMAMVNPMMASQVMATEGSEDALQTPALMDAGNTPAAHAMALVATPYGYAIQVPVDALQEDMAAQLAQMQQALLQSQMTLPPPGPMYPYDGLYATPFGYMAMNQAAGQFGGFGLGGFGQPAMMNIGYQPAGMLMPGQMMPQQGNGLSVSDLLQIMAFINSNKPQGRTRMADRIAERRENRRAAVGDPFTQLMEAWTTPYTAPNTTLRMPSRNAYPYGHFGVQAMPMSTANYGGFHNLYMGNTTYPGLY